MAATTLKLFVLIICLNTSLYLGMNFVVYGHLPPSQRPHTIQNDLFDIMLTNKTSFAQTIDTYNTNLQDGSVEYTQKSIIDLAGNFSSPPNFEVGADVQPAEGGFSFLDVTRMVSAFIITLWSIAIIPLLLFSVGIFPPVVNIIIGVPLALLEIYTLVILIRGGGAA